MMLTGQVFTIMSETATDEHVLQIVNAVDKYLFDQSVGGYKLNTDFHELKSNLGRMFGFAYGNKENGAVFSHMAVMYAYALYSRGFSKEGYKVLQNLYEHASNADVSCIYPGIPEYFNGKGRGLYHYLTGAASWYMLTTLTQMFGVKGYYGDLLLEPKLLAEQFDENKKAQISCFFAEKKITVIYENKELKEIGDYEIEAVYVDYKEMKLEGNQAIISRKVIEELDVSAHHMILVTLI